MSETKLTHFQELTQHQTDEISALKQALEHANQQAQQLAATVIASVSGTKTTAPINTTAEA